MSNENATNISDAIAGDKSEATENKAGTQGDTRGVLPQLP